MTQPAGDLVAAWKGDVELIHLFDMFSLNIDYSCKSYADVCRLNEAMLTAAQRYNMFYDDDSKKGRAAMRQFIENFITLQSTLGVVFRLTLDRPSQAQEISGVLLQINGLLRQAGGMGVHFSPPKPVLHHPALEQIGLTAVHMAALASWLPPPEATGGAGVGAGGRGGRKDVAAAPPARKLDLVYQASRDGFGAAQYHAKCDNTGGLLTIIQTNQRGWVFGGFTSESNTAITQHWQQQQQQQRGYIPSEYVSKHDPSAFLFTLINPHGIEPTRYVSTGETPNVVALPAYGPAFGNVGQCDLLICNSANQAAGSKVRFPVAYTDTTGHGAATFTGAATGWTVKEILVFKV